MFVILRMFFIVWYLRNIGNVRMVMRSLSRGLLRFSRVVIVILNIIYSVVLIVVLMFLVKIFLIFFVFFCIISILSV